MTRGCSARTTNRQDNKGDGTMTQPPTTGPQRPGEIAADDTGQTGRILGVDDVPENIRLLEALLGPRGYTGLAASSGRLALDLVAEQHPDLILLDIMMPDL